MNAAAEASTSAVPGRIHGRSERSTLSVPERHDSIKGFVLSVALHGAMLLLSGWLWTRPAGYGVTEGASAIEVELIAAPLTAMEAVDVRLQEPVQEPVEAVQEPEPMPAVEAEAEPEPESEAVRAEPPPAAAVQPSVASQPGPIGDGSSAIPGQDAVSQRASAGAQISAKPSYLRNPAPRYPEAARKNGEEGLVLLNVEVSPLGRPVSVELAESSGFDRLDQAALAAVRRWVFEPARLGPLPIASNVRVPVRFRLSDRG